ncbi:INO80 complex subunit C isoform X1 [Petromyzon marinus]|uniref:INO80 complex subunit C isoform X1 n=2 Tax=Petromyzon marinus TaxID=7757 RepID=A0AAJ7T8S6_PETMA|nr:INO80 complex subunit C isoform X1 [Petromyzon marinus]
MSAVPPSAAPPPPPPQRPRCKKRPGSSAAFAVAAAGTATKPNMKKRVLQQPGVSTCEGEVTTTTATMAVAAVEGKEAVPVLVSAEPAVSKALPFKNPSFTHSGLGGMGVRKSRVWKNLKQIIAAERSMNWSPDDATYSNIDAPPSFKPAKKYSDLSGLPASYTDPQSKLHFSNAEEFSQVRTLPMDIVSGYLALRKATSIVP